MKRIIEAILIFFAQVLVLNHLDFSAYIHPQIFIAIILVLPPYLNKSLQIGIAFILGLIMDLFLSTPGIHASCCTTLALARFAFINRFEMEEIIANKTQLSVSNLGLGKFLLITGILVPFYHLMVFGLESIGALHFVTYLLTVLVSSLLALVIILLLQFLFHSN
ncbi:hypothetical protein GYB22_10460 [bacterium]|nr:hypothetical protein [bacterium]